MNKYTVEFWYRDENISHTVEVVAENLSGVHRKMEAYDADSMFIIDTERKEYGIHG